MTTTGESHMDNATSFEFDLLTNPPSRATDVDELETSAADRKPGARALQKQIRRLSEMVASLNRTIEGLQLGGPPEVENGLDFYDEVRRFQADLIMRALKLTGGSQIRAARLLKMNHSTLNMKIKHLQIEWSRVNEFRMHAE